MKATKIALIAATVISVPTAYAASPDFNQLSLGLGYRMAASSNTDVYGVVSYEEAELEDYDENGYGLTAGIRSRVTPNIELDGGVSYIDLDDDDDTYLNLGASYYFTPAAAVSVSYRTSDDNDIMGVSARYSF